MIGTCGTSFDAARFQRVRLRMRIGRRFGLPTCANASRRELCAARSGAPRRDARSVGRLRLPRGGIRISAKKVPRKTGTPALRARCSSPLALTPWALPFEAPHCGIRRKEYGPLAGRPNLPPVRTHGVRYRRDHTPSASGLPEPVTPCLLGHRTLSHDQAGPDRPSSKKSGDRGSQNRNIVKDFLKNGSRFLVSM